MPQASKKANRDGYRVVRNDEVIIQRLMGLLDSHDDQPANVTDTHMVDLISRLLEQQKMVADLQAKLIIIT